MKFSFATVRSVLSAKSLLEEEDTDLEIGAKVSSDVGRITLRQNGDLLLYIFYIIICCFQINDLDGYHTAAALVDSVREEGGEGGREEGGEGGREEGRVKEMKRRERHREGREGKEGESERAGEEEERKMERT